MAITIDSTVGGASANSFATLAEWVTHMDGRLNASTFDDASADTRNRALAEATRELSALTWAGYRVDDTQALSWPRQWAYDPDSPVQDYYVTTVVPDRVKRATYELAFEFLKAGTTDIAALDANLQIQTRTVDVIKTEYVQPYHRVKGLSRYPSVMREIRPLLFASGLTSPVVRS